MTFLKKAKMEQEEKKIKFSSDGMPNGCPYEYGYEEEHCCHAVECEDCWNREMPNTELEKVKEEFGKIGKAISKATDDVYKEDMNTAYNKGLNDAWELAKKIWCGKDSENEAIFGTKFVYEIYQLSPQEVLAKLKTYETAQEQARLEEEMKQIKVGNVVIWSGVKALVMDEDGIGNVALFTESGCIEDWIDKSKVEKTDKHIDIQNILEQIK